ncbi:major capsid protein [Rhizobium pisi]|uniref:major capsid protein n=1 Tax=Rhizobium pisi TaxID=574561 RepID=UPI003D06937E
MSFVLADVYNTDTFNQRVMMDYITTKPYNPQMFSKWLPWNSQGELSHLAMIEFREGSLSLIPEAERGAPGYRPDDYVRSEIPVKIPHFPMQKTLLAESVRGTRAFGSELMEVFEDERNTILQSFTDYFSVNWENSRAGAITGKLYKANGVDISKNWFDIFDVQQTTHEIDFDDANADMIEEITDAKEKAEDELGDLVADGFLLVAGRNFQKKFKGHVSFKKAFDRFDFGSVFRQDGRAGVVITNDVNMVTYTRGKVNGFYFIDPNEAYLCPLADGMYQTRFAPGLGMSTLGAKGLPENIATKLLDFDEGIEFKGDTNVISYVQRPKAIVKLTAKQ